MAVLKYKSFNTTVARAFHLLHIYVKDNHFLCLFLLMYSHLMNIYLCRYMYQGPVSTYSHTTAPLSLSSCSLWPYLRGLFYHVFDDILYPWLPFEVHVDSSYLLSHILFFVHLGPEFVSIFIFAGYLSLDFSFHLLIFL